MKYLEDHVVLITGAGSGLGRGLLRRALEEGAQAAVLEISAEKVEDLRLEFGEDVLVRQGDVCSIEDLQALRGDIEEKFGHLDAFMGSHGIFDGNIPLIDTPLERIPALFDELMRVNVLGNVLVTKVFAEMLKASRGAIVLTSSTAAYAADGGGLFYAASKGAVRSTVNQLGFELAPQVRVNGVAPSGIANSQLQGPAALGLQNHKQSDVPKEDFLSQFKALMPLDHLPTPEEYGHLYTFLASRHNTLMTGQTIVADQGLFNRAVLTQDLPGSEGVAGGLGKVTIAAN